MKKRIGTVALTAICCLSACQHDTANNEGTDASSSSSSSSGSSSASSSSGRGTQPPLTYTSHVQGNHALLTNTKLDEMSIDFTIAAALPEMMTLGNTDKWDTFIEDSKQLGFDEDNFEIIYEGALLSLQHIRNVATVDLSGGIFVPTPLYSIEQLQAEATIDIGLKGKNKHYNYIIKQQFTVPQCQATDDSCTLDIDIDISLTSPGSTLIGYALSDGLVALHIDGMVVSFNRFKIANTHGNFEILPSKNNALLLNGFSDNWEAKPVVTTSANRVQPFSGPLDDGYSHTSGTWVTLGSGENTIDIQGVYSRIYTDDNGDTKELQIVGAVQGSLGEYAFLSNYDDERFFESDSAGNLQTFEQDNAINDLANFDVGTLSGYTKNIDLQVQVNTTQSNSPTSEK